MNELKQDQCNGPESVLLPWYVNDTLDENERDLVQAHLYSCEDCRQGVELLSQLQRAVQTESPSPLVPAPRHDKLLAALDRGEQRGRPIRHWHWLATAAAIVMMAGTAIIMSAPWNSPADGPVQFETATSSPTIGAINFVVELEFGAGVHERARSDFFNAIDATDLPVRIGERSYRLTLSPGSLSLTDLEVYIEGIRSRPEIAAVEVVAVQLPVE